MAKCWGGFRELVAFGSSTRGADIEGSDSSAY